jgi:TPP-dependent 2-oxoacid decarboxylase
MDFPNSASFDNLVKYIQIPWDLENFLELLHLLVNVPENATREEIEEKFLTPLINALSLNENEKEELRKKLSENLELMIAEDKKNILNKDYLQLYKEIYTMLNELVMKENE